MTDIFPAHATVYPASCFNADTFNFQEIVETYGNYNTGGIVFSPCRAMFTDAIFIGMDNHPEPTTVYRGAAVNTIKVGDSYGVLTDDGSVVIISKIHNCGCGSRLRSWSPYRTLFK
jgi:hypothetical protein